MTCNAALFVQNNADETYVRTILENLVDNSMHSLRVGGGPGRITIHVATEGPLGLAAKDWVMA